MVTGAVARDARVGAVGAEIPDDVVAAAQMATTLLGDAEDVKGELDRINAALHEVYAHEPDWVLRLVSGFTPRLTELERLLFRAEIMDRRYARLRTMDCRPLLDECDRQLKVHSRLLESRRQDLAMAGVMR